jgi:tetratricopeptide (TPR) repeat protein
MGLKEYVEARQTKASHTGQPARTHPIVLIKRARKLMASMVAWLIGLLFFGVGCWILLLRFEGLVDRVRPHNMSIGQMTVDGIESRGHAELLRTRFDHHFRRPVAISKETGFLEMVSLDTPELFQQKGMDSALEKMTVEVSGVDVAKLVHFVNQLAKPEQWIVEGDFQTQTDRAVLALRLSRGERLIRTWYLERLGNATVDKSILDKLIDDAIFQLVYDFGNEADSDPDLRKWRHVVPAPTSFPSPAAVAAYYEARGALGRYYAQGTWNDLDVALERLQALRGQMPEYADGLRLLAVALAEKRNEIEAIHVYEQLRSVLLQDRDWSQLPAAQKRRVLSVDLLKATATSKLYTWQSAHQAIGGLLALEEHLRTESAAALSEKERAAYTELRAQTAVQLAYTYALYLSYIRQYTVAEMFGNMEAPRELRVSDAADLKVLRDGPAKDSKAIVRQEMKKIAAEHRKWIESAEQEQTALDKQWGELPDGPRSKAELAARLQLAAGYANYRMAELEPNDVPAGGGTIFGETFDTRLEEASKDLRKADAAHPNHYLVLQLLGLVYSEPRREGMYPNIAEQYLERAIRANPSDYYGHELLAGILLRRVGNIGLDLGSRVTIEKGLAEAEAAIHQRDVSGGAHLLRAQFQTMLLEIERSDPRRRELRAGLEQYIEQADRFLPRPFNRPDVDLTWVRVAAATRRLGEDAEAVQPQGKDDALQQRKLQRFKKSKEELTTTVDGLIADCHKLEDRWVASQRVFQIKSLGQRARRLREEIHNATLENWREIPISFL